MIGKNIKSSVIGGVTADSKGTFVAAGIDSTTGDSVATNDYIAAAGGKVVTAALANQPGS